jgi:RecB family exonuclease
LRAPFHIITTEKDLFTEFGGVRLKVRVDRVDELESGGRVILDYKTGLLPSKAWEGTRPDEPQLPIYAATLPENLTAIAFAAVTTQPAFKGVAARDKVLPAMKASRDPLPGMVEGWREVLVRLGEDFAAGRIFVDPKKRGETCRLCDLKPLCRLAEQPAFAVDGQNGDE